MSSASDPKRPHRPQQRDGAFFDAQIGDTDPAGFAEAADRAASLIVRGARESGDAEVAERVVRLAQTEGLVTLSEVWGRAPAESLAGSLWRLYVLRAWVDRQPTTATEEFEAGLRAAPTARVIAGVAEPPTADALRTMLDEVLRGVSTSDYADVLFRAAAFARVVAAGRASLEDRTSDSVERVLMLSEQLEAAGHLELSRGLG